MSRGAAARGHVSEFGIDFSDWREVNTKRGPRLVRSGLPTDQFWDAWRESSERLKLQGFSVSKNERGEWNVAEWRLLDDAELRRREEARAESRAQDSEVEIPVPDGLEYLPYQRAGIVYASKRDACLIGDDMGLGKTIQAVGVLNINREIERVLIVCPASLRLNWAREIEKWAIRPFRIGIVDGKFFPSDQPDVLIINYDVLKRYSERIADTIFDLAVFDEAHYLKDPRAQRTKAALGVKALRWLFLTGTPIPNRPKELFPMLSKLDPKDLGRNFFAFARRYCAAHRNRWGWDFDGASNKEELQDKLRERCMIRRRKVDVLKELPPKRRQVIEIPPDGCARLVNDENLLVEKREAIIAELRIQAELSKASESEEEYRAAMENLRAEIRIVFGQIAKTRQELGVKKVPYVVEHLREALAGGPVVCFAHHRDVVASIAAEFPEDVVTVTGETALDERQFAVDEFQAGRKKLFIGNIKAAGVGLTLTASSHVVFAELDWTPANIVQAEDRCHRIGQLNPVLVQHIVFARSVDCNMAKAIVEKQNVIDSILDDERESELGECTVEPTREKAATESMSRRKIIAAAKKITPAQNDAIHLGLRMLAGMCDGAREIDGRGFNKIDTAIGKSLAICSALTARQAALGRTLIRKYRRQLPDEILETAFEGAEDNGESRKKR